MVRGGDCEVRRIQFKFFLHEILAASVFFSEPPLSVPNFPQLPSPPLTPPVLTISPAPPPVLQLNCSSCFHPYHLKKQQLLVWPILLFHTIFFCSLSSEDKTGSRNRRWRVVVAAARGIYGAPRDNEGGDKQSWNVPCQSSIWDHWTTLMG